MSKSYNNNTIFTFENMLSAKEIKDIEFDIGLNNRWAKPCTIGSQQDGKNVLAPNMRQSKKMSINRLDEPHIITNALEQRVWPMLRANLPPILGNGPEGLLVLSHMDVDNTELLFYEKDGFFDLHTDSSKVTEDGKYHSRVTVLLYASDSENYDDSGTLYFDDDNKTKITVIKGRCVAFFHQLPHGSVKIKHDNSKIAFKTCVYYELITGEPELLKLEVGGQSVTVDMRIVRIYFNKSLFATLADTLFHVDRNQKDEIVLDEGTDETNGDIFKSCVLPFLNFNTIVPIDAINKFGIEKVEKQFRYFNLASLVEPMETYETVSSFEEKALAARWIAKFLESKSDDPHECQTVTFTEHEQFQELFAEIVTKPSQPVCILLQNRCTKYEDLIGKDKELYELAVKKFQSTHKIEIRPLRYIVKGGSDQSMDSDDEYYDEYDNFAFPNEVLLGSTRRLNSTNLKGFDDGYISDYYMKPFIHKLLTVADVHVLGKKITDIQEYNDSYYEYYDLYHVHMLVLTPLNVPNEQDFHKKKIRGYTYYGDDGYDSGDSE